MCMIKFQIWSDLPNVVTWDLLNVKHQLWGLLLTKMSFLTILSSVNTISLSINSLFLSLSQFWKISRNNWMNFFPNRLACWNRGLKEVILSNELKNRKTFFQPMKGSCNLWQIFAGFQKFWNQIPDETYFLIKKWIYQSALLFKKSPLWSY